MFEPWQLGVQICYGILLFPLYIFVLINFLVPKLNKPFQSYFFKIATVLGFVDITTYITVWIFVKLPASSLTYRFFLNVGNSNIFIILTFLRWYTPLVRCYLLIISSANRFTALNFAIRHVSWWNKFGNYAIILSFVLPSIFTVDKLFGNLRVYFGKESIAFDVQNDWGFPKPALIFAIHASITCFIILTLNFLSLRTLMKQTRLNGSYWSVKNFIVERSLLVITFWDFIVDSLYVALHVWQVYRSIMGNPTLDDTSYTLIIWILDLNNLFRPIFLILMCKALKKSFLKLIYCKKRKVVNKDAMQVQPIPPKIN